VIWAVSRYSVKRAVKPLALALAFRTSGTLCRSRLLFILPPQPYTCSAQPTTGQLTTKTQTRTRSQRRARRMSSCQLPLPSSLTTWEGTKGGGFLVIAGDDLICSREVSKNVTLLRMHLMASPSHETRLESSSNSGACTNVNPSEPGRTV
jgi:hypothetical protein